MLEWSKTLKDEQEDLKLVLGKSEFTVHFLRRFWILAESCGLEVQPRDDAPLSRAVACKQSSPSSLYFHCFVGTYLVSYAPPPSGIMISSDTSSDSSSDITC
jgi:hypothetical protein